MYGKARPSQIPNSSLSQPSNQSLQRKVLVQHFLLILKIVSRKLCTGSKLSQVSSHIPLSKLKKKYVPKQYETAETKVKTFGWLVVFLEGNPSMLKCVLLPEYSQISTFFAYYEKILVILQISSFYDADLFRQKLPLYKNKYILKLR